MKVYLSDHQIDEIEKIEDTWLISDVNKHGDLTIYRNNAYVLYPMSIAQYAAGEWLKCY
jgi:hypothetical protein